MTATLTHLERLEGESIQIMREAVAEAERPVMLYSVGKDSTVMLRLARKAFYPSTPPFPLLRVDTTWKFQAMYDAHRGGPGNAAHHHVRTSGSHHRLRLVGFDGEEEAGGVLLAYRFFTTATTLELNEIGVYTVTTDRPIPFDPYETNRDTGGFILIDRLTNATVGAGLLHFALRRSKNVHWQAVDVTPEARSALKGHRPGVIWFTGLSGAGKSTIANRVEQRLHAMGVHTALLDGDNVRHGLNHDLGFTDADRIENIRRVGEVARLMADAGLIVLVSFISPFRSERDLARSLAGEGRFCEVFVDTSLAAAEARDPKGLYRKARRGELPNFTGIDSPYEEPEAPEVRIDTNVLEPGESAEVILERLRTMGIVPGGPTA